MGVCALLAWLALGSEFAGGRFGAIMGVVGAFLVLYPRNSVSVFLFFIMVRTFEMPSWSLILLYLAFDVWYLASSALAAGGSIAHVAAPLADSSPPSSCWHGLDYSTRYEQNLLQIWKLQE